MWLYNNEKDIKNTIYKGEEYIATVQAKSIIGENGDKQVEVFFTTKNGKLIDSKTSKYISQQEWDKFEISKPLSVIYIDERQETYVQQSIMRFKSDNVLLYYYASGWLALGIILFISLRNYKVGVKKIYSGQFIASQKLEVFKD